MYVVRNRLGVFETTFLDLGVTDQLTFTYDGINMRAAGSSRADCSEVLYAVNNQSGFASRIPEKLNSGMLKIGSHFRI